VKRVKFKSQSFRSFELARRAQTRSSWQRLHSPLDALVIHCHMSYADEREVTLILMPFASLKVLAIDSS